jgi:hypothetical protein
VSEVPLDDLRAMRREVFAVEEPSRLEVAKRAGFEL